ncbi:MAG: peptidase M61, partial [Acidobacteriaceae bacterium]
MPPAIVAPVDTPYPGTITLDVNLTNTTDRVVKVHEAIPVKPGELTLLYPEWIPGNHSPTGPIQKLAGLFVKADGKTIPWVRDRVNVYAFHIDVPTGVTSLEVDFDYLSAIRPQDGRIEISSQLADLAWNTVVLYPAGHFSRDIRFQPNIQLPSGWKYATALETASQDGDTVHFKETPLNTLVDSPLIAGEYFKRVDLSTGPDNPVFLDIVADEAKDLEITPEELQDHKNLAIQAQKLFASHHYNHYDLLFMLTDVVGGQGLEHHQSSEDGTRANYFTDWAAGVRGRDLLAHEYTHSWNGKFRRPGDLWTPNFNVPMR